MKELSDPPAIIQQQQADYAQLEAAMSLRWQEYKQADATRTTKGLALGKACYELQQRSKAQGSRKGLGFEAALQKLGIPTSTAYKWIARYRETVEPPPRIEEVDPAYTVIPELSPEMTVIGTFHGTEVVVRIEPATEANFFYVTCFERNEVASGMVRPVGKHYVLTALSMFLNGELDQFRHVHEVLSPEMFEWIGVPSDRLDYNPWLFSSREQYFNEWVLRPEGERRQ